MYERRYTIKEKVRRIVHTSLVQGRQLQRPSSPSEHPSLIAPETPFPWVWPHSWSSAKTGTLREGL